jgi:hypothetical protein
VDDEEIIGRISQLADEEKRLEETHIGEGLSDEEQQRLRDIGVSLDRMWDLLRQRRALRRAGRDPDEAVSRPEDTVEGYLQ